MVFFALSFLAGVLSVFAACVLPLLPVIIGGSLSTGGERRRTYVIVAALAISVVAFTLLLKASTVLIGIPEELWRYLSGGIIFVLGVLMIFPDLWTRLPGVNALNLGSNKLLTKGYQRGGFWGDVLMGAALGPVFASCSPTYFLILATVLPATPVLGTIYLAAYAAGLSLSLLAVALLGEKLVQRLGITLDPSGWFFRSIGAILIIVGTLVFTGTMRQIETWFVERGFDATRFERLFLQSGEPTGNISTSTAMLSPEIKKGMYKRAVEFVDPDGYINTEGKPITLEALVGKKVVLLDIWTYSCINCQRTFPYLKDWYAKYKDHGLEIVGIHTPEFAFEKLKANVERASQDFGLTYPIILDNRYLTWTAYGNNYWPRKYLVDIDGYIVYDHIGEGAYAETEQAIQRALAERAARLGIEKPDMKITMTEEGTRPVRSPEVYFGSARNELLGNGEPFERGGHVYVLPQSFRANTLYLSGAWTLESEYASNEQVGALIRFEYGATNVYFVASAAKPVKVRVTRDGGEPLGADRGSDVGEDGIATIYEDRLYKLVEGEMYGEHTLEIEILTPNLKAYTFTFG